MSGMTEVLGTKKISGNLARSFLLELANLKDDPASVKRFLSKFAGFFPSKKIQERKEIDTVIRSGQQLRGRIRNITPEMRERARWLIVSSLQIALQHAWRESDSWSRQWRAFLLCQHFWMFTTRDFNLDYNREDEVPPRVALIQAIDYFLKHGELAKWCQNASCPAPYFFAARKSQIYCSDICAAPSKRAAKLRWWNLHGKKKGR